MSGNAHKFLSETVEHGTPPEIIESARVVLGGAIDLDPSSDKEFNKVVRAKKIYTEHQNGYMRDWRGNVFLNPPGGLCDSKGRRVVLVKDKGYLYESGDPANEHFSAICLWWFKLAHQWNAGTVPAAIFIGFSLEILQSAQAYKKRYFPLLRTPGEFPICLPRERLRYLKKSGDGLTKGNSPTHASVIVFLPPAGTDTITYIESLARFRIGFEKYGDVRII